MSDLEEYIRIGEPSQRERAEAWQTAIGLQEVDQLHVSRYLLQTASEHVEGAISQEEVEQRLSAYYQTEEGRKEESGTDEADQVAARIVKLLSGKNFTFSPSYLAAIHRQLFSGILPFAGSWRDYDISKKEWVLNQASVLYGAADYIPETLRYDFSEEQKYSYRHKQPDEIIEHLASFVAGIWQIHPFREGNTRTTAVFTILYLRSLGYKLDNSPFEAHSWYFRNALVRANYDNLPAGITHTTEYLCLFFRNILLGEHNELKNRYLHVDWKKEEHVEKHVEKHVENISPTADQIVSAMQANPQVTAAMLQEQLHLSRRGTEDAIARLKKQGRIRREGGRRDGKWLVIE